MRVYWSYHHLIAIFAAAAIVGTALAVARLSIAQQRPSEG